MGHSFRVHTPYTLLSAGRNDLRLLSDDAFSVKWLRAVMGTILVLLPGTDTDLDIQLAVGIGLLRNLLGHDVGNGRKGGAAETGTAVNAHMAVVLRPVN